MAQVDWHEIAQRHRLSPQEKQAIFLHVNTLTMALSGRITPTITKGAGALMDLPISNNPDDNQPIRSYADLYLQTEGRLRAAIDDLLAAYTAWLKLT